MLAVLSRNERAVWASDYLAWSNPVMYQVSVGWRRTPQSTYVVCLAERVITNPQARPEQSTPLRRFSPPARLQRTVHSEGTKVTSLMRDNNLHTRHACQLNGSISFCTERATPLCRGGQQDKWRTRIPDLHHLPCVGSLVEAPQYQNSKLCDTRKAHGEVDGRGLVRSFSSEKVSFSAGAKGER